MFESKRERNWILTASVILLFITTVPYIYAYSQNDQYKFTGFLFGVEDGNSYIAKMLQGAEGEWLFRSPYTTVEQRGFLAFVPYMLIGKLTSESGQHDQLVFLFHAFRWLTGILLIFVTYLLCAQFITSITLRRMATLIAVAGGGSGWFALLDPGHLIFGIPLEVYSPETFGFLSLFGLPHLLAARAFLLLGFLFFFRNPKNIMNSLTGGFCWLMTGFFQPLTIVTGWVYLGGMTGVWILIILAKQQHKTDLRWHVLPVVRSAVIMVLVSSPWVIYNLICFSTDPYLKQWAAQNLITSPAVPDYLLSFLVFVPFAVKGVIHSWPKSSEIKWLFPLTVLIVFPVLAYAPFNMQRRLPDGIWLVIGILAISAFEHGKTRKSLVAPTVLTAFSMITPILILIGATQSVRVPSVPIFQPRAQVEAFECLDEVAEHGSIVLAAYETANALPAWADVYVPVGLGPESANFTEVLRDVKSFYSGDLSSDQQIDLLQKYAIDYVFHGAQEKKLGDWNPVQEGFLQKVCEQNGYAVYEVTIKDRIEKQK